MKKVLITDDEKSFLLSLQDGFSVHDDKFTLLTAENGQVAVDILQETSVDLLVTDLEMPQMNGFELLAWVSRHKPQLPVIVMTAFGTPEIESRLAHYDTLKYLEKPLDLHTLESAILAGLDGNTKSYIQGITPAAFLQLLNLERKSCTLKVISEGKTGYLFLQGGNLVDAEYGDLSGESAANRIVCWEKAEIEMDNLNTRQDGTIKSSLESILLNAHTLKDEQQHAKEEQVHDTEQETVEPTPVERASPAQEVEDSVDKNEKLQEQETLSEQVRELLCKRVHSHKEIAEFILFDQHSIPDQQNPGKCSLHVFDPAIYLHLVDPLDEKLGIGACNWISFFTARRTPFLLFKLAGYSLLVKLQQGVRSQMIAQELSKTIKGTVAIG